MSAAPISFLLQLQGDVEFKSKLQSASGNIKRLGEEASTTASETQTTTRSFKDAALGMGLAASAGAALYFQFGDLQRSEVKVREAEKNIDTARASLIGSQQALTNLIEEGITSGDDYERAQLRVSAAEAGLQIATEKATFAQGDMNRAHLQFALSTIPTVIGAASSAKMALAGLGFSFKGAGAGAVLGGGGIRAFGAAIKATMLAMGPIGWILIGIGGVLTAIATNAFGVRDAINEMGKALGDLLPFLKPVLEFMGSFGDMVFGKTEKAQAAASMAGLQSADFGSAGAAFGGEISAAAMATPESFLASMPSGSTGHGFGGKVDVNVKVYVDGKEIASKIKISTARKG